jgi:hypothetical protein
VNHIPPQSQEASMPKLIRTYELSPHEYTICAECPCCNISCEDGESCNLYYSQKRIETKEPSGWVTVSDDCKLELIRSNGKDFLPVKMTLIELKREYEYTENEKYMQKMMGEFLLKSMESHQQFMKILKEDTDFHKGDSFIQLKMTGADD